MNGFSFVVSEIWNIFTYYSLHGNSKDPSKLNLSQFIKLCKDSMLFDKKMVDVALSKPIVQVVFSAQVKARIYTRRMRCAILISYNL